MRRLTARIVALVLFVGAATTPAIAAEHRLAEAVIDLPEEWEVSGRAMDRELTLEHARGGLSFDLFWWNPTEPILSLDAIVSRRSTEVQGHKALLVHSEFPGRTSLQVVFEKQRPDGLRLIVSLESADAKTAEGVTKLEERLDGLLARLRFVTVEHRPKRRGGSPLASPAHWVRHIDRVLGFALDVPAGWHRRTRMYYEGRRFTLRASNGEALVSIGGAEGDTIDEIVRGIETYRYAHYNDHIMPDELSEAAGASIGDLEGVYLVARGESAGIDGHALAFDLGRSWAWEGFGGGRGFWFAAVRAEASHPSLDAALETIVKSFDPEPEGGFEMQAEVENALELACAYEEPIDDPSAGPRSRGGTHATRDLLSEAPDVATWDWLMRCGDDGLRVFGLRLDPVTAGRPRPLLARIHEANALKPFAIVDLAKGDLLRVEGGDKHAIRVTSRKLAPGG